MGKMLLQVEDGEKREDELISHVVEDRDQFDYVLFSILSILWLLAN